jgi:hypothetical protein
MRYIKLYEAFKKNNQEGSLITIDDVIKCIQAGGVLYATIIKEFADNDPEKPLKPVSIDDNFKEFILDIMNSGGVNQKHYNSLTEPEKIYFHKIVKGAGLSNALKFKADDKIDDKKDIKRLDVLVGQITAGNDNDKVLKEAKELIKKCVGNGSITKYRGMDLLLQIE